ncbi:MAG: hypothetical protein ACRECC_08920 [Pseudolabrys sp.]|jgi:hypothetical protein
MLKPMFITLVAALIAGAATLWSASGDVVSVASPIVSPAQASAESPATHCEKRAWPYMHCVGTPAGNLRVRLVTTDRLTH